MSGESESQTVGRVGCTELQAVRHDLRNLLDSLRYGCMLIGDRLSGEEHAEVHALVEEMRTAIGNGAALVERLRAAERTTGDGESGLNGS